MIDLYTAPTANCRRVSITLEELGLAYSVHPIDRAAGDQRQPDFLKVNPAGAVPVVVDPDGPAGRPITVAQSGAILIYLAEKTGLLLPSDLGARTVAMEWLLQVLTDVNTAASALFLVSNVVPEKTEPTIAFFRDRLFKFFKDCDRALAESDYLAGELSIADLALYPVVEFRRAEVEESDGLENLRRWAEELAARSGVRRGMKVLVDSASS